MAGARAGPDGTHSIVVRTKGNSGGDVEMGTSQNPASGRRGFSFNALNLFHLLTSSFRAERAKRYNWNASQQGIFLLIGYAGREGGGDKVVV